MQIVECKIENAYEAQFLKPGEKTTFKRALEEGWIVRSGNGFKYEHCPYCGSTKFTVDIWGDYDLSPERLQIRCAICGETMGKTAGTYTGASIDVVPSFISDDVIDINAMIERGEI